MSFIGDKMSGKFKVLMGGGLVLLLAIISSGHALAAGAKKSSTVKVESAERGIPAQLIDEGDYYVRPDGSKIKFYRKRDVYAVEMKAQKGQRFKIQNSMARFKAMYGNRVQNISSHGLGARNVVRLNNSQTFKAKSANQAFDIMPSMLKALDSSISQMQPVLANANGSGDILISHQLLIKLSSIDDAQDSLTQLAKTYGLEIGRKLKTAGEMYIMEASAGFTTGQRFALSRSVMASPLVEWVQPLFSAKPYKTSFEPNDPLFNQQWYLRNKGIGASRCDTDCDANEAWGINSPAAPTPVAASALSGAGMVIAVVDDGVQLDHEDLTIWANPNASEVIDGADNDGNGCVDDINGCDFVDDALSPLLNPAADITFCKTLLASGGDPVDGAGVKCRCQDTDGTLGPDGDPSPQADSLCLDFDDEVVAEQDNHGTAVAGIAAASGNNGLGVSGTAYSATILPVRLISDFDDSSNMGFCARVIEALTYAGRYADVINNSWGLEEGTCDLALEDVVQDIVDGTLMDGGTNISHRPNKGSPVIFSAGNSASGWIKVTVPIARAGEHAYEWRFLRTDDDFAFDIFTEDDAAWVDDIIFPDASVENFDAAANIGDVEDFTSSCGLNTCYGDCEVGDNVPCGAWSINSDENFSRTGNSAQIDQTGSICSYSYLHTIKDGPAGEISFWVWVSTDTQDGSDRFEFLIDGREVFSIGDRPRVIDNAVAYPANLTIDRDPIDPSNAREPIMIAVGASDSGDLSNTLAPGLEFAERVYYSQYGETLDLLAPSSNQHLGIYTTDRYGAGSAGYNANSDISGDSVADPNYTNNFGGTSASAPIVAGVAAAIIAVDNAMNPVQANRLSAADIEQRMKDTADKIGRRGAAAYDQDSGQRSDFYGHGRVNMFEALKDVLGVAGAETDTQCAATGSAYNPAFDPILNSFAPEPTQMCPAQGPLVPDDSICFPVKSANGNVAVFCL